ncbi:unnamed protein product, partial [Brassica rapa subsp. trilocularis]
IEEEFVGSQRNVSVDYVLYLYYRRHKRIQKDISTIGHFLSGLTMLYVMLFQKSKSLTGRLLRPKPRLMS